jgi:hypothetical protein
MHSEKKKIMSQGHFIHHNPKRDCPGTEAQYMSHCVSMLQGIGLPVAFIIKVDDGDSRFLWNISTESSRQLGNTTHKGVISWTLL